MDDPHREASVQGAVELMTTWLATPDGPTRLSPRSLQAEPWRCTSRPVRLFGTDDRQSSTISSPSVSTTYSCSSG